MDADIRHFEDAAQMRRNIGEGVDAVRAKYLGLRVRAPRPLPLWSS